MAPLYDQPVRVLLTDMIRAFADQGLSPFTTADAIDWFAERYPKVKEGTIRAHLRRFSANDRSRLHYYTKAGEGLLFKLGANEYRMYDPKTDPPEILPPKPGDPDTDDSSDSSDGDSTGGPTGTAAGSSEFAYERDLQHYLAKNLDALEPGLRLWEDEDGTTNGIEFDVGGRRIDILAIDKNNDLVVIELKVSKGYDRVVGQLLRYMAWIEKHQADETQKVRGVIIARSISDDLRLATSRVAGVSLYEYTLSISLSKV